MVCRQVKFRGLGVNSRNKIPNPFPLIPWQTLQGPGLASKWKSVCPAKIFSGLGFNGLINWRSSSGALGVFLACGHKGKNSKPSSTCAPGCDANVHPQVSETGNVNEKNNKNSTVRIIIYAFQEFLLKRQFLCPVYSRAANFICLFPTSVLFPI